MSLQIWLPLMGNTDNFGLSPVKPVVTGTVSYVDGKLGSKCANLTGGQHYLYSWTSNSNQLSVSYWTKPNGTQDWGGVFSLSGSGFRIEKNTGTDYVTFGTLTDTNQVVFSLNNDGTKWYHVAITLDGSNVKFYLNGTLTKTLTQKKQLSETFGDTKNISLFATRIDKTQGCRYTGSLQDFRMYDHALSTKEVKEISKGLTMHFPLRGLDCNPNLVYNSQVWNNSFSGGNFTRTTPTYDGKTIQRITCKTAGTGGFYTACFSGNRWNGKQYTWSFYARANKNITLGGVGHERGGRKSINVTTEWQKFSHTWTYTQTSYNCITFYSPSPQWEVDDWFEIMDLKIEEGSIATPWCPHIYDKEYELYGYGKPSVAYTLTGAPSSSQGYISSFATTKYIDTNYKVLWNSATTWDMYLKFLTGSDVTTKQTLTSQKVSSGGATINLQIVSGYFTIILGTGSSWDILTAEANAFAVSASKTYYVKVSFTGSAYTVNYSTTSFDNLTQAYSLTSSTKLGNDTANRILGCNRTSNQPWLGGIDMEEFRIDINKNPVFLGKTRELSTYVNSETSGYNRTVTSSGRFHQLANTPKNCGISFISGSQIVCTDGFPSGASAPWTISFWHKPTTHTYSTWSDVCGFYIGNASSTSATTQFRLESTNTTGNNYVWYGNGVVTGSGGCCGSGTVTMDTWRHVCLTYDGSIIRQYVNGSQYNTYTVESSYKGFKSYSKFYIGQGGMYCDLSDFRVYATCLSATDVKEIYNTPISIDNTGKLYCSNMYEE